MPTEHSVPLRLTSKRVSVTLTLAGGEKVNDEPSVVTWRWPFGYCCTKLSAVPSLSDPEAIPIRGRTVICAPAGKVIWVACGTDNTSLCTCALPPPNSKRKRWFAVTTVKFAAPVNPGRSKPPSEACAAALPTAMSDEFSPTSSSVVTRARSGFHSAHAAPTTGELSATSGAASGASTHASDASPVCPAESVSEPEKKTSPSASVASRGIVTCTDLLNEL